MARVSFEDNNHKYVKAFIARDYSEVETDIHRNKSSYTFCKEENGILYGYNIAKNVPLTDLYGDDFYAVRFAFANIDTMHIDEQEKSIIAILNDLERRMNENHGYYNLRIPTHIVDLIKAYNQVIKGSIFCGGTVEQYVYGKRVADNNKNSLKIFAADDKYVLLHNAELLDMTYQSFKSYQGQYHISHITDYKAGMIYENWIKSSLSYNNDDIVVVAEYNGIPIGFVTLSETENAVEGVLSAVADNYRRYGAYKAMIAYAINYANDKGKSFITSTQFDNFVVQRTWASLGLAPFYSIYNVHLDRRLK